MNIIYLLGGLVVLQWGLIWGLINRILRMQALPAISAAETVRKIEQVMLGRDKKATKPDEKAHGKKIGSVPVGE